MGLAVVDAEGKTRLLSFQISPGHTKKEWLKLFNNTKAFCRRAKTAIVHCDGEAAIKDAFYESDVFSHVTKQTCARHAAWTTAITVGKDTAER